MLNIEDPYIYIMLQALLPAGTLTSSVFILPPFATESG